MNLLSSQAAISIKNAKLYSEVKESERELRESKSRLDQFLEAIPVGIAVLDASGRPYYTNQRAIQLLGKGVVPSVTSDQLSEVYQLYIAGTDEKYPTEELSTVRALRGERTTADNLEIHQGDTIIPIETWGTPIFDENSNVTYALVAFQDITKRKQAEKLLADYNRTLESQVAERTLELEREIVERKRAEVAAQEANQAKSTFLANMSHELRTPLNTILGFSQLMSRSSYLPPEHQENLNIITRSGEHLLTMINQVLDLSKIEVGRTTLNKTSFDIHRLLDDLEDMFQLKADDKGLQLIFNRTPSVPQYVYTDEVKLRQVLINLLSNATKFTQQGSVSVRVSLKTRQRTNDTGQMTIHFEVEDTGCGIAPEELDNLFEAFVQTTAGQQFQEGTGLGLTIARSFVQLMGGEMSVSSQLGRGSVFNFDIQVGVVETADIKSKQPTHQVLALEPNQPSYRILVVDDNWENRQLLIKLLSPLGFELQEASNGQEAIEIYDTWEPHLIWMDIRMPVMDGIEATKRIKATTKGQMSAIIALTASVLEEKQAVILSAGCDDFIRKPFRDADIFDAMHKHIGVRYIYDELDEPTAAATSTETKADILTPAEFAALPPDLVDNLRQAICNLDLELIQSCITQIGEQNEPLANAIAVLANHFRYKQLLNLIQATRN
ncbi:MAG: response regulator [Scytonema sp. CRU_2_7]|nr:response regulator [Scytonema sp. CRU_2_7]